MQFRFVFKHMETSEALENYARSKIQAEVSKFVTKPIEAQVTFQVDKHHQHVLCSLVGGDGFSLNVEHDCPDMYASVDHMIDKLSTQLKKRKDKLKDHKHPKARRPFATVPDESEYASAEIDASDIIKFENSLRRKKA